MRATRKITPERDADGQPPLRAEPGRVRLLRENEEHAPIQLGETGSVKEAAGRSDKRSERPNRRVDKAGSRPYPPSVEDQDSGIRLAELVAAFSLATDLGFGQPMEHVLRSWLIAARMSERIELEVDARPSLYYVITLAMVGCVAETPELAEWFGDDIAFRRDGYGVDLAGLPKQAFALRHVALGSPSLERLRRGASLAAFGSKALERILITHCIATGQMADELGLGGEVSEPLQQVFARWDGRGVPSGLAVRPIAMPVRLFHLADDVEVAHRSHGLDAALELVRARSGTQLDPSLVDAFCADASAWWSTVSTTVADWIALIEREPGLQQRLTDVELDSALEAIADFTDLRSPSRAGHSRAVAELSARAAEHAGLPDDDVTNAPPSRPPSRPRHARYPGDDPRQARPAHRGRIRAHADARLLHGADARAAARARAHR